MKRRRHTEGFNIAFLDIMASGLGAIILLLIIVKHDVDRAPITSQADQLQTDLSNLQQQDTRLKKKLTDVHQNALAEVVETARLQSQISALKADVAQQSDTLSQQQSALSSMKNSIKKAPIAHQSDVVKQDRGREEQYIMGLQVKGRKIVFLIDSSASMTDETLIAIIHRKNTSNSEKKRGPKWLRTKRIVRWLLARAPATSQVAVVAYNARASILAAGHTSGGWFSSRDTASMQRAYSDLDKLVPTGSTNLQRGLQAATRLYPTDVYLVTDGLPTAGQSRFSSLNPFSSCGGLLGRSNKISGVCRVKLFRQTLAESAPGRDVTVNVVLLPIEGDPQAAPQYWAWTASTHGLLIMPAPSWP